jgi:competence protein ComEC
MKYRKIVYTGVAIGICFISICFTIVYQVSHSNETKIVFLDIGQGDAILISRGTQQILIDGGPDGTILMEQLGKQIPFWDRNIEIVIATHPDSDHIDGLVDVFENYSVNQFWHTSVNKNTSVYSKLLNSVKKEELIIDLIAYNGLKAFLNTGVELDVIYPFGDDIENVEDVNDTSIAMLLHVGDEVFYFGGDLSSKIEDILPIENVTVLKASHHGSNESTSNIFLQKITPRDVIISAGNNNRYGHPHEDVLKRIEKIGAQVFRTDKNGAIIYNCKNMYCELIFEK